MEKPLIVYKASAGSGKTFTLAIEYIKLLILNPQDFRSILAVTFTNKATEEMKIRILSQLYGIWKRLDDSKPYIDVICADLGVSSDYISKQAGVALQLLLHNYSYFRIETIDSFFQSILRNLARELDLTANLRIGLNDIQIEEQAVDELIDELDSRNEILQWILKYIKYNISEDKSWNVIGHIKSFGKNIFKDFYKESSDILSFKISQAGFFEEYISRLYRERNLATERMQAIADKFFQSIMAEGLTVEDFAYGKNGVAGFFMKLKNGVFDDTIVGKRVSDCVDNVEKWVSKNNTHHERIYSLVNRMLIGILKHALDERAKQWCRYKSADLTLHHLNQLRLLNSIERKVRELNIDANRFLLSDTQYLLMSLINDSDSPFIYEKIGAQLKHIMIDEFQDTSMVQWKNFKVLLLDCMSREKSRNIIVGDVKQSIYRWRDSDWRLLNNIDLQFILPSKQLDIRTLDVNYRSQRNIVHFNNVFFKTAAELEYTHQSDKDKKMAGQLKNAYKDVEQLIPKKRIATGYVNIELLPAEDYYDRTMETVHSKIMMLIDNKVPLKDIAILVRTNKYIPLIARYFTEHMPNVRIVSDEAFRLDASLAVNMLVHALHLLTHNNDTISKAFLVKAYQNEILDKKMSDEELLLPDVLLDSMLPIEYVTSMNTLRNVPLYNLAEQIYYIFNLKKLNGQSAYVCSFFDQLSGFTEEISTDIDTFVDKWNEEIGSKTIQSDEIDGIRLISIHKSKGLEFDNVIIPFCDWQMEKSNGNIIWCNPKCVPFDGLPLVPVDYGKGLIGTIYEKDYLHENFQNRVDNLNLLYVAFTRAGYNLFIIGKRDAPNSRSTLIQECLSSVEARLCGSILTKTEDKGQPISFEYGSIAVESNAGKAYSGNLFLQPVDTIKMEIETFTNKTEFKQSNNSRNFIDTAYSETDTYSYIKIGAILHKVFSSIQTSDDIDGALSQLETDGILYDEDITSEKVISMLRQRLSDPRVQEWFSDKWTLFNECSILYFDKSTNEVVERRPDRVMMNDDQVIIVDFKFGHPREEYRAQVQQYMELLSNMDYHNIKGYLWFVYSNRIEEV